MASRNEPKRAKLVILWTGVAFVAVAVVGHLIVPGVDILWGVLAGFGVLGMVQAFFVDRPSGASRRRSR